MSKTDAELKTLAEDIFKGNVFTDRNLPPNNPHGVTMVFPVLWMLDKEQIKDLQKKNKSGEVDMFYEYLDRASPRSCNGYPMFFSVQILSKGEAQKVWKLVDKMKEAMASVTVE